MPRVLSAFIAEHGVAALIAEAVGVGMAAALTVYAVGEGIHHAGLNPFDSPAASAASSTPALADDGAGMGSGR
jgi:hypothetical protein